MGGTTRRRVLVAAAVTAVAVGGPQIAAGTSAQPALPCTITDAYSTVWSAVNISGAVQYYGHAIMHTRGCGVSPAQITATFRPMAGSTTTCDNRATLRIDDAACTSGFGAAIVGTHVVIDVSGHTEGEGGADAFTSSCTIVTTTQGPASCRLPVHRL